MSTTCLSTDPQQNFLLDQRITLLPQTDRLRELRTILRDKETNRSEFVFCADRLIRLVVEEGLNKLPYYKCTVITPTGCEYEGLRFARGNCGVAVCRSGEAMELALRQCCRSIRIGKVLIGDDQKMLYTRLMTDISRRRVLLLYPLLITGDTVVKAIQILLENGVKQGLKLIRSHFEKIVIVTSEICTDPPAFFTTKYFGTD
uniref:Uracil phosphoribosyltransferase n=1 Tax=Ditylenchus dipsaci TaxID=166011 RepID=A0A915ED53_9BILA